MSETDKPLEPDEAYALERFAKLTDEERRDVATLKIKTDADTVIVDDFMSDADIMAMLRDEYWEMQDAESGQTDVEDAEIQLLVDPSTTKH